MERDNGLGKKTSGREKIGTKEGNKEASHGGKGKNGKGQQGRKDPNKTGRSNGNENTEKRKGTTPPTEMAEGIQVKQGRENNPNTELRRKRQANNRRST